MANTKQMVIIVIVLLLVVGLIVFLVKKKKKDTKENYINVQQDFYLDNEWSKDGYGYDMDLNVKVPWGDDMFMQRPTLKSHLAPRMYPGQYAAELRGPVPPEYLKAVPINAVQDDPSLIDFSAYMASTGNTNAVGGMSEEMQKKAIKEKFQDSLEYVDPSEILPGDDMASIKFGKLASDPNTYIYDRLIYANKRRRNLEGADFIRGDLPIVPTKHDREGAWFQPSAKPHLDLRKGAFAYIAPSYETIIDLEDIISNSLYEERNPKMPEVVRFD